MFPNIVVARGYVELPGTTKITGNVELQSNGKYNQTSEPTDTGLYKIEEAGTRSVLIKDGTILIHTKGKKSLPLSQDVDYIYDIASEIHRLRERVASLESKLTAAGIP